MQLAASVCRGLAARALPGVDSCPWQCSCRLRNRISSAQSLALPKWLSSWRRVWFYSQDKGRPLTGQLTTVEGGGAICSGSSGSSRAAAASAAPALRAETVFKSAVQNLWESPQSAGNTWRLCCSISKHEGTGVSPSARAVCYLTAENRACPVRACAQHGHKSKQTAGAAQTRAFTPCAGATAASRRWKGRWKRS